MLFSVLAYRLMHLLVNAKSTICTAIIHTHIYRYNKFKLEP